MSQAEREVLDQADAAAESLARVKSEIGQVVFGQERMIELTLCAILAGGHALLVGAPGLAKTTLVSALATALNMPWSRVQFTPDLMPADILGSEVLEEDDKGKRHFRFIPGPIFTSLLMADEINRASPRTQSALLQAMQEHHVTVTGARHDLPQPFHVLATQNPIEQDGTYPLPEAQLDRFLLQIETPFPDRDTERRILIETTGANSGAIGPALPPDGVQNMQSLVRRLPVGEKVVDAILRLVRSARPDEGGSAIARDNVSWGPGPRAGQALMLACRARALLRGRIAPSLDDVVALARPALAHRMALNFTARADGVTVDALIDQLAEEAA